MWLSKLVPGHAPDGTPILSVLGKRTYLFSNGEKAQIEERDIIEFYEVDEFHGEANPSTDAVKHESDLIAYKPQTDILFHGKAIAPEGQQARFFDMGVEFGNFGKRIHVVGNRHVNKTFTGISFSEPELFTEMPLHFGLAYGGVDTFSEEGSTLSYTPNPAGKGFAISPKAEDLHMLELPNLEDPNNLLTPKNLLVGKYQKWIDMPKPVALGYTSKSSYPRYTFAGMPPDAHMDQEAIRQQMVQEQEEVGTPEATEPMAPTPLMNHQYFNGAAPELQVPYIKGDERVYMLYMDPEHEEFEFTLPNDIPKAWIDVGEGIQDMDMVCQTVEVFKSTNQITVVWRGSVAYGGPESMTEFTKLEFGVDSSS